jgi:uncharacterized protein (TIGR02391 family)
VSLKTYLPTAELVTSAPLVELAGCVLRDLAAELRGAHDATCVRNYALGVGSEYDELGAGTHKGAMQAVAEAWGWLCANGLICHHVDHDEHWMTLTRLGRVVASKDSIVRWVEERELPASMLDEDLAGIALPLYRQGRFDTAVFEAFKAVEVAIRDAAGLGHDQVGVGLASKAFHPENGPLSDQSTEKGERVALMSLMCGALGSYKNPHSHRRVEIGAREAREMLVMASHLLCIVQARRALVMRQS